MAIPIAVIAQNPDDQMPDQNGKPSPSIPMQGNDQDSMGQGSMGQGSIAQGSDDQDSMGQGQMPQAPVNQGPMNQGSVNQGSMDSGSNDAGGSGPSYSGSAPEEKNGVARISLIHGDVSTQRGDSKDWSVAALNAPVLAGDRVSTGDKARVELQLDYANMLRLAEHTQANIVQ